MQRAPTGGEIDGFGRKAFATAVTEGERRLAGRLHKLRELSELLHLAHGELVSLDDLGIPGDPEETGTTFRTNAAIKARFGARASGLPTPQLKLSSSTWGNCSSTRETCTKARSGDALRSAMRRNSTTAAFRFSVEV